MDYATLPARELERHARNIQPGAWAVESQRPLSTLLGSCGIIWGASHIAALIVRIVS